LRLYFAIQFLSSLLHSEGASENSPQFQLRVNATKMQSPAGATDKIVAENSAAPPGLADFYRIKPAVETAGYSHPSPRDCAANPKKRFRHEFHELTQIFFVRFVQFVSLNFLAVTVKIAP
jgi:hypothetical protein